MWRMPDFILRHQRQLSLKGAGVGVGIDIIVYIEKNIMYICHTQNVTETLAPWLWHGAFKSLLWAPLCELHKLPISFRVSLSKILPQLI